MKTEGENRGQRPAGFWARAAWNGLRANGESLLGIVPRPRALTFFVTYDCNLRCRTCGIWKQGPADRGGELSPAEITDIFSDPLFARLEYVNINGGEPVLRPDLLEIVERILERLPRLRSLSLNTNGIPSARCVSRVAAILEICRQRRVPLAASISLHAPGPDFDGIVGCPGAWKEVQDTLESLQALKSRQDFSLTVNCVVSALNASRVEDLAAWSRGTGIPANFVLGEVRERFFNQDMAGDVALRPGQVPGVIAFFNRLSREEPFLRHHRLRYRLLAEMLASGRPRRLACHYRIAGAVLGSRGELFYCKAGREIGNCRERSPLQIYFDPQNLRYRREELLAGVCPHCLPYTLNRQELEKDAFRYLIFLASGRLPR